MPFLRPPFSRIAFYLFLVISVVFLGCGRKKEDSGQDSPAIPGTAPSEIRDLSKPKAQEVLAAIGDEVITIDDYKKEIASLPSNYRAMVGLNKNQFLEGLINKRLLLKEAKKMDLQNSENVKRLFEKVQEEIMVQEFIDREISGKAQVAESEIEKFYQENLNNFGEKAKIRARHILVDSDVLAKKISSDLERGGDFAELAREYSLDIPTKDSGGDIGYFAKGTLIPEFEEACEKLNIGQISDTVKTDLGYHIIEVLDKKEASVKTLEEVKNEVKSNLLLDKEIQLYSNLIEQLRKAQEITVNNQLLESINLSQ